jgi:hypothetical protein
MPAFRRAIDVEHWGSGLLPRDDRLRFGLRNRSASDTRQKETRPRSSSASFLKQWFGQDRREYDAEIHGANASSCRAVALVGDEIAG